MATHRQDRIVHLTRINRGKTEWPEFLLNLSVALGTNVDEMSLIDLESTDELVRCMGAGYAAAKQGKEPGFARYFSKDEERSVFNLVSCLKDKLTAGGAFAYFRQSEVCGAVAVDAAFALARAKPLLDVDGNGLSMVAEDRNDGFMLDFNPDDPDGDLGFNTAGFAACMSIVVSVILSSAMR